MSWSSKLKIVFVVLFFVSIGCFLIYFAPKDITQFQSYALNAITYLNENPVFGTGLFILLYLFANSVPMPFVSLLSVLAGYLFGTLPALIIVSFTSAIGASFLFLISRYLLKNWIQKNLLNKSKWLAAGLKSDNFWSATGLRLVPGMPFSVPSIALSFTQIQLGKFYLSTQLGLFFSLLIYVNAGSQLTELNSVNDIFTFNIIISMLLLALVPILLSFISKRFLRASN